MRYVPSAILVTILCSCSGEPGDADRSAVPSELARPTLYRITKLPSLGGDPSRGMAINARGMIAGWSNRADGARRAVSWKRGSIAELPTLGGPNNTVAWPGLNDAGWIVGVSQTADVDPLDEDWSCEAGGFLPGPTKLICRGFVFKNGRMHELSPLGGNHGFAAALNDRAAIVGWSETALADPTCLAPQVLQFRATLWDARKHPMRPRELVPLGFDSTSAATAINDRGDVVGISGDCDQAVGRFSARHAVRWDKHGNVREVPNLGGVTWHTPMDINEVGDIVGFSNPPGAGDPEGEFIAHAFLVRRDDRAATDLGTLPGDAFSQAHAINRRGQVVGVSFGGASGSRAFLWQNGMMTELTKLVPGTADVLLSAQDIDDEGEITGRLRDGTTGETLAFVATPVSAR
jgi:probable HAF family extracellular repeat protein